MIMSSATLIQLDFLRGEIASVTHHAELQDTDSETFIKLLTYTLLTLVIID